jgi:hypothetical protein
MAKNNPRISKSGVTSSGRIVLFTNSPEAADLDPSLVYYIQGNSLSSLYLTTADTDSEDISPDDEYIVSINDAGEPLSADEDLIESNLLNELRVPSLSDISIVSNNIVYDAAGNPSVTLVFKIKNSSGENLKGMNARIELA